MQKTQTKRLVLLALFIAIEVMLWSVPNLGLIRIFAIEITTLHIPVIIASIVLGTKEGVILGFVFGLLSMITATNTPLPHAAFFSPFATGGNIFSLLIVFGPRMLLGFIPGYLYRQFKKPTMLHASIFALIATIIHTILVLSLCVLFFKPIFTATFQIQDDAIFKVILGIISVNGIAEAILAAFLGGVAHRLKPLGGK